MAIIPHTSLKNLSDRIAEILSGMEAGTNNHEELAFTNEIGKCSIDRSKR